ncbi:hypothetical protein [Nocardia nova]|uniref:hypothetical protein n=1 Tax=Nocardia nova TaxID=37330 RepID=UPI0027390D7A|nr:hypothetical protein [Nocardia nova]
MRAGQVVLISRPAAGQSPDSYEDGRDCDEVHDVAPALKYVAETGVLIALGCAAHGRHGNDVSTRTHTPIAITSSRI